MSKFSNRSSINILNFCAKLLQVTRHLSVWRKCMHLFFRLNCAKCSSGHDGQLYSRLEVMPAKDQAVDLNFIANFLIFRYCHLLLSIAKNCRTTELFNPACR